MLRLTIIAFFIIVTASALRAHAAAPPAGMQVYEAVYNIGFRGLPLGDITVRLELSSENYALSAHAVPSRVVQFFARAQAVTASRGAFRGAAFEPARLQSAWMNDRKGLQQSELIYADGVPQVFTSDWVPEEDMEMERDEAARVIVNPIAIEEVGPGTRDPFSAFLNRVEGLSLNGACQEPIRLFDGRRLAVITPQLIDTTPAYAHDFDARGPLVNCQFAWLPLRGYTQRSLDNAGAADPASVRFARVPFTEFLAPVRVAVSTPYGDVVITATRFFRKLDAPSTPPFNVEFLLAAEAQAAVRD